MFPIREGTCKKTTASTGKSSLMNASQDPINSFVMRDGIPFRRFAIPAICLRYIALAVMLATLQPVPDYAIAQDKPARDVALPATDDGLPGSGPIRRYDWFKNLWQQRRSQWMSERERDRGSIVFLGDSITQGWGERMTTAFAPAKVSNRGISGDTTRGMLIRLQDDVISLNPSCVVMLMGTNDLEEQAEPETIVGNIKLIIQDLKKHNKNLPIIVCQVFPSSETKKRPASKIRKLNELVADAVAFDPFITVLDTWTLFADTNGDAKIEEFPDLLHPNAAGYEKWEKALRPILETLGFVEEEVDTFKPEAGFVSLFNGKDLSGWCVLPTTPEQIKQAERWKNSDRGAPPWPIIKERVDLDGKTTSPDGRYLAKNGRLIVTIPTEGRRIQQLWTTQSFPQDFTLKLEFRASPNADSGVFLRQPQLQCRDYPLAGPYKYLKNYKQGDWNELVVVAKGGLARCTCNGEVLEEAFKLPETGPIGLEGDRGQMEYRRIRIRLGDNLLSPSTGLDGWRLETAEGGVGSIRSHEGAIEFNTTKVTGTNWHVHGYQSPVELEEGGEYVLKFKLKSPDRCPVTVIALINQADWHEVGLNEYIHPTTEYTEQEFTFRAHSVVPGNNRISFELGESTGRVYVKDIELKKK